MFKKIMVGWNIFTILLVLPITIRANIDLDKADFIIAILTLGLNFVATLLILELIKEIKEMLDNKK